MTPLHARLRELRLLGDLEQARELIRAEPGFRQSAALQRLLHEHEDFWWQPVKGRLATLKRRDPADAAFVRACWADAAFMNQFNRVARSLPKDDAALARLLERERCAIVGESHSVHWTIHSPRGPVGFVSATDFAAGHRRCEFMLGLLREQSSAVAVEAATLAIGFLRDQAGIERLVAYIYPDNAHAIRSAQKFGFEIEGRLRGQMRAPDGSRHDLLVLGMLICEQETTRAGKMLRRFVDAREPMRPSS